MNYGNIKYCDIADGEGVRTTLFVSGCTNHCKNCFQPQTWDFNYGSVFTEKTEEEILASLEPDYVDGLTLLGGEPFEPENQRALLPFLKKVRSRYPQKNIWSYTGFVYDRDLLKGQRKHCEATDEMLSQLKVLVDGPFVEELHDITLRFCGSSNQRLIDMQATLKAGKVVLYELQT